MITFFLFEFGYLPAPLAPEATSVTLTEAAGRITIVLPNRALGHPHALTVSHTIISFVGTLTPSNQVSLLLALHCSVLDALTNGGDEFPPFILRFLSYTCASILREQN